MVTLELTNEEAVAMAVIAAKMPVVAVGPHTVTDRTEFDKALLSVSDKLHRQRVFHTAYDPVSQTPVHLTASCTPAPFSCVGAIKADGKPWTEAEAIAEYNRGFRLIVERKG